VRSGSLLLVGAALCVGLGLVAPSDGAPRLGKVVRVERGLRRIIGTPRYCAVSIGDLQAWCYGKRPETGEKIEVIDSHHLLGTLRIESVDPIGTCAQATSGLWLTRSQLDTGDLQTTVGDVQIAGIVDVTLDHRRARLVKVDRVVGDRPIGIEQVIAIDADGDGAPDVEFLPFPCDDAGNPPTVTTPATGQCVEVWYGRGRSFERLRVDRVSQNCF
jgi:hypothetical protein